MLLPIGRNGGGRHHWGLHHSDEKKQGWEGPSPWPEMLGYLLSTDVTVKGVYSCFADENWDAAASEITVIRLPCWDPGTLGQGHQVFLLLRQDTECCGVHLTYSIIHPFLIGLLSPSLTANSHK